MIVTIGAPKRSLFCGCLMELLNTKVQNLRAAVFDLDGTLLRSDKTISKRTAQAVQDIATNGWYVAVATGRHPFSALRYLKHMGVLNPKSMAICFNGSALINLYDYQQVNAPDHGFKTLFEDTASKKEGAAVASLAKHFALHTHAYSKNRGLCMENTNMCSLREFFHAGVEMVDGFDFINAKEDERYYKLICVGSPKDLDCFRANLTPYIKEHFEVMRTDECFLEFIPHHCSKGSALDWLSRASSLKASQIVAFGDAENDMLMIKKAGFGVAMGNAITELRENADYITASNDEDGIALVLERLLKMQSYSKTTYAK